MKVPGPDQNAEVGAPSRPRSQNKDKAIRKRQRWSSAANPNPLRGAQYTQISLGPWQQEQRRQRESNTKSIDVSWPGGRFEQDSNMSSVVQPEKGLLRLISKQESG